MAELKYTKGEWEVVCTEGYWWIHNKKTDSIIGGVAKVNPEEEANANLISASPNYHEAVKEFIEATRTCQFDIENSFSPNQKLAFNKMIKASWKAEGRKGDNNG